MRQTVLQGGSPNRAPIGYLNVRVQTDDNREFRMVKVDPEWTPHITWAFEAYATGEWSVARPSDQLGERGLRTRPTPSRSSAIPMTANLHQVLKNGTAERTGDRWGQAAWAAGPVMLFSYSTGVNRSRATCRRRRL